MIVRNFRPYILLFLFALCSPAAYGQSAVADHRDKRTADSLDGVRLSLLEKERHFEQKLATDRERFSSGGNNRDEAGREIVRVEGELFRLRDTLRRVNEQLRGFEGRFSPRDNTTSGSAASGVGRSAYLVNNDYLRRSLTADEYQQLLSSQNREEEAAALLRRILYNYDQLFGLDTLYSEAAEQQQADSLMGAITRIRRENQTLTETFSPVWGGIFDNKVYLYNRVLDSNDQGDALAEMERSMNDAMAEIARNSGQYMYEALSAYYPQKELLLLYETRIAQAGGLGLAADSLQAELGRLTAERYYLPRVETTERLFMDYGDYRVTKTPVYNIANPIPPTKIYPRGTIYRIFVGAFTNPQPVSLFRNVSPMSVDVGKDKKNYYYIAGYRTYAEAEAAAAKLKAHGFKNPRIVAWHNGKFDGKPTAPKQEQDLGSYRIEISGAEATLPPAVNELIREQAKGRELVRRTDPTTGMSLFSVGSFGKAEAEHLSREIKLADGELTVRTVADH